MFDRFGWTKIGVGINILYLSTSLFMMVLMMILSGLEGGMPSTCSSMVVTLVFSTLALSGMGFLTLMIVSHT